jgi:hypothetical protein
MLILFPPDDVYRFNQQELPPDVLVDDLGVRLSQASSFAGAGLVFKILD